MFDMVNSVTAVHLLNRVIEVYTYSTVSLK